MGFIFVNPIFYRIFVKSENMPKKFKKKDLKLNKDLGHVQVVLINDNGNVCLVSRKDDHSDFGLVGGSIEKGETPEKAIIRETKEETGLKISNLKLIFAMHRKNSMGHTYLADYSGSIDFDEEKEPHIVKWGSMKEAMKGSFSYWNKLVDESLKSMGINLK